jgi:hypothetical protein
MNPTDRPGVSIMCSLYTPAAKNTNSRKTTKKSNTTLLVLWYIYVSWNHLGGKRKKYGPGFLSLQVPSFKRDREREKERQREAAAYKEICLGSKESLSTSISPHKLCSSPAVVSRQYIHEFLVVRFSLMVSSFTINCLSHGSAFS